MFFMQAGASLKVRAQLVDCISDLVPKKSYGIFSMRTSEKINTVEEQQRAFISCTKIRDKPSIFNFHKERN